MKQVVVRPAAAADIEEAYEWYERQRPGLGEDFLAALRSTLDRVASQPQALTIIHRATRRALVPHRFPYGMFYRIYGDTIVVVACMHAKRHPRQWQQR
ncbi:MAG: type II toxin-antitoxin system RelE/ParE family toxin [Chloroflexi bacterium]|nr:type II toxin-antitoxin system RelE/ParE family toxin [Chloroflexota bacterium]